MWQQFLHNSAEGSGAQLNVTVVPLRYYSVFNRSTTTIFPPLSSTLGINLGHSRQALPHLARGSSTRNFPIPRSSGLKKNPSVKNKYALIHHPKFFTPATFSKKAEWKELMWWSPQERHGGFPQMLQTFVFAIRHVNSER